MDPHAVEVCLPRARRKEEERTLSSLPAHRQLRFWPSSPLSPPLSSSRPKAANGIMLNPRRGKFATRRRDVYPPLRAVSPSREKSWLVRDDGFVFSTVLRSGSMETFSFRGVEAVAEARYGSSNRNTVRRFTMLSRVNI